MADRAARKLHMGKRTAARVLSLFLILGTSLTLTACDGEEVMGENTCQVYYLSTSETKVEPHSHEITADTPEGKLEELIGYLSTNPEKLEYKAPLGMGFQLLSTKMEESTLILDVDADYLELPVITEVLVRAAIVRSLTQLEEVKYVSITVEGGQLYDGVGRPIGRMNAEQFINNDGNEINTYELARIQLYFSSEDGASLIAANREKYYSTSMQLERFVVEELIAGPTGQVEGLYPSVNPNTKIINVTTKDGICYVNLDENFLAVVNNVPTEESVYAIVNSLVELSNINKVQILVNGEVPSTFSTSTFERNLDIVTTLEK